MTRAVHLAWAKARAYKYIDAGDWMEGWMSFVSDLQKHDELAGHMAIQLGSMQLLGFHINEAAEMRKFIEGVG